MLPSVSVVPCELSPCALKTTWSPVWYPCPVAVTTLLVTSVKTREVAADAVFNAAMMSATSASASNAAVVNVREVLSSSVRVIDMRSSASMSAVSKISIEAVAGLTELTTSSVPSGKDMVKVTISEKSKD